MTQYEQQPPPHPATAYYPAYAATPPQNLTLFGVLAFATAAAATVFDVTNATVVGRAVRHLDEDTGSLDWSVVVYGVGSVLESLALLAGWIFASIWLLRARKNAQLLAPQATYVRSPGWAWGGWVCPVVSLWFPFQVVRDTHRATRPVEETSTLVGWWWALYLLMQIGGRLAGRAENDATAADASGIQAAQLFFAVVMISALVLWGLVLRTVTTQQHGRMYAGAV